MNDFSRYRRVAAEARRLHCDGAWFCRLTALRLLEQNGLIAPQRRAEQAGNHPALRACFGAAGEAPPAAAAFAAYLWHTDALSAADYRRPELAGQLYQCFIEDRKKAVFDTPGRVRAEDVPARTQIFTPEWLVRYLTENTAGRLWRELHPESRLELPYLVPTEGPAVPPCCTRLEELRCADFSCGTGHLLLGYFRLLLAMAREQGLAPRQAVSLIFNKLLVGVDLDRRAAELARFALLLAACQADASLADAAVLPRVYSMPESPSAERLAAFPALAQAAELGSLMCLEATEAERAALRGAPDEAAQLVLALTDRYAAIAMNPPYMEDKDMSPTLRDYVARHYKAGRQDLMTAFMLLAQRRALPRGRFGILAQQNWMFLRSFRPLRLELLRHSRPEHLLHLGPHTFDELKGRVVQAAAFTAVNEEPQGLCRFLPLTQGRNSAEKEQAFLRQRAGGLLRDPRDFLALPDAVISYGMSAAARHALTTAESLRALAAPKQGLATTDNARYLRRWYEVDIRRICFDAPDAAAARHSEKKWFPYSKGGAYRRWYGNFDYVVNWEHDGAEIKQSVCERYPYLHGNTDYVIKNTPYYFREGVTWSKVTDGAFSARLRPAGSLFDVAGCTCFADTPQRNLYVAAFLNSKVAAQYLSALAPTVNYEVGAVGALPLRHSPAAEAEAAGLAARCCALARADWDSRETSWGFTTHPLLQTGERTLDAALAAHGAACAGREAEMRQLQRRLNALFAELYGLSGELDPEPAAGDITLLGFDRKEAIRSLISYAVGCLFGRYRADAPGVQTPPPEPSCFLPLLPAPFDRTAQQVGALLTRRWGAGALPTAERALGAPLGDYLREHFDEDHRRTYSLPHAGARPIYWLFSSRRGAFRALVYLHRLSPDTPAQLLEQALESYLAHLRRLGSSAALADCLEYRERLHAVAAARPCPDPDAGVLANRALYGDVLAPIRAHVSQRFSRPLQI